MLGGISGSGVLTLFRMVKSDANKAGGKTAPLLPLLTAEQKQRRQDALEALNTMKMAVDNQKQQGKAAAQAKVERLKKELEALRMMGGDSKAVARRAAQIARELAAAAKEYAAAGGSGMAEGGTAEATQSEANQSGQSEAGETDTGKAAPPQAAVADAAKVTKPDGKGDGKADDAAGAQEDERSKIAGAFQQLAADMARQAGEKKADSEFAAEVRRLMSLAKSIVAQERRRAEQKGGDEESERLARQVQQAEADMEESFSSAPEAPALPVNIVI